MDSLNALQAAQTFNIALAQSLSTSFTQRLGSAWQVRLVEDSESAPELEKPVGFSITADGGLHGECRVALDQSQVIVLAAKLLGETPSTFEGKHLDALMQVFSSATAELSAALLKQYGAVTFAVDQSDDLGGEKTTLSLLASSGEGEQLSIQLHLGEQLLDAMRRSSTDAVSGDSKQTAMDPTNLQLVMDVELNVSLRFGQCQLPLREVLDLASGSVIELDRDVDDPVELLLDGKVIARGEAVIVDGNYGLRITEIPEPIASHFGG